MEKRNRTDILLHLIRCYSHSSPGLRQRKRDLDLELKRLTDSIAQGKRSQSIMNAIGEREEELRSITDKLLEPAPGSIRAKLEELREFAVTRLTKIRELLAHPENVQKAHEALAESVGQLTLEPVEENGKRAYLAHGKVDFFGEEEMAHSDGAGGPEQTERHIPLPSRWRHKPFGLNL
jgi:hypothetical protein